MEHLAKCFRIDVEHYFRNKANNPIRNQLLNPRYMFSLAQGRSKLGRISGNPFEEIPRMRNISLPQMEICFKFLKVHGNGWIVVSTSVQFGSVDSVRHVWLFATPWTAADQASLSFTISQSLLKLTSIESMMPSNHLIICCPFSSCLQSFPASGSFPMSRFFASGGQRIGASASASVLPMNIQDWFPLGLISLTSLISKELSRVLSSTIVQKHQFFSAQSFLHSKSHIHTWPLEKSELWRQGPLSTKWYFCFLLGCLGLS